MTSNRRLHFKTFMEIFLPLSDFTQLFDILNKRHLWGAN